MEDQNRSNISKKLQRSLLGSGIFPNPHLRVRVAAGPGCWSGHGSQAKQESLEKHEAASRVVVIANSRRVAPRFDQVAGLSALYVGVII